MSKHSSYELSVPPLVMVCIFIIALVITLIRFPPDNWTEPGAGAYIANAKMSRDVTEAMNDFVQPATSSAILAITDIRHAEVRCPDSGRIEGELETLAGQKFKIQTNTACNQSVGFNKYRLDLDEIPNDGQMHKPTWTFTARSFEYDYGHYSLDLGEKMVDRLAALAASINSKTENNHDSRNR